MECLKTTHFKVPFCSKGYIMLIPAEHVQFHLLGHWIFLLLQFNAEVLLPTSIDIAVLAMLFGLSMS